MRRTPSCSKEELRRGPWTATEDTLLINYIQAHGHGNWRSLPKKAGNIAPDEEDLIMRMHALVGNRWSLIAGRIPGRTDNEIKNYWNSNISKKLISQGIDPHTHKTLANPNQPQASGIEIIDRKQGKMKEKVEPEKQQVYKPKALRFTSLSSPNTNEKPRISEGEEREQNLFDFHFGDENFYGSESEFLNMDPISDHNFDNILDEYLQLLNN